MPYIIFHYVIMLHVFRSSHHCSGNSQIPLENTCVGISFFSLEMMKLYEEICPSWIKVDLHSVNLSRTNDTTRWQIFVFSFYIWGEQNVLFTQQICYFYEPERSSHWNVFDKLVIRTCDHIPCILSDKELIL